MLLGDIRVATDDFLDLMPEAIHYDWMPHEKKAIEYQLERLQREAQQLTTPKTKSMQSYLDQLVKRSQADLERDQDP